MAMFLKNTHVLADNVLPTVLKKKKKIDQMDYWL